MITDEGVCQCGCTEACEVVAELRREIAQYKAVVARMSREEAATPEPQGEAVAWVDPKDISRLTWPAMFSHAARKVFVSRERTAKRTFPLYADPLYTRPQPGEGGGEVSDEMVAAARQAYWDECETTTGNVGMKLAIEAALRLSKGGQGG